MPSTDQRSSATSSASCRASSASSKSLTVPIRAARMRSPSRENVSDTTCCIVSIYLLLLSPNALHDFQHRPNLNGTMPGARNLRRNLDSFVEVVAVEHIIAAELLFRLTKRSIRRQRLAVAYLYSCRCVARHKRSTRRHSTFL